ncbi:MAG TPA: hypothetical protein VHN79_12250 [Lacunisphaera sp.]|nr:hypothetical protein [Lacunisphaera sp.]
MTTLEPPLIRTLSGPVLSPQPGVPWADTMLLNPSIIDDPVTGILHMLFRATGPWPQKQTPGRPLPYPIFLGYATSLDDGKTWQADFSRPCLAPQLEADAERITIRGADGKSHVNYANGCIEDPRLFRLEGKLYLTTACRMFPPGPYWEHDEPTQCAPTWATEGRHSLGPAATTNLTVTVLWQVDLAKLAAHNYAEAFTYVTHLSDPLRGDNRDVFPFPEKMTIAGRPQYVCLHRPFQPGLYDPSLATLQPSIFVSCADRLEDLGGPAATHRLLATPVLPWEGNRVGASWVPISLGGGEWLLPYHAKQDTVVGYTQSFMILKPGADGWPAVAHRCSDRLMYARKAWELNGRFKTPCVFTCGGIVQGDDLIMSYGAADNFAGVAWVNFAQLVAHVRRFDAAGKLL